MKFNQPYLVQRLLTINQSNIIKIYAPLHLYINVTVSNSWPNGWTKLAEILFFFFQQRTFFATKVGRLIYASNVKLVQHCTSTYVHKLNYDN